MKNFKIKLQKIFSLIIIFLLVLFFNPFVSQASEGEFIWGKSFEGAGWDQPFNIKTDNSGNVYTVGAFQGTIDFDPGVGTSNVTSSGVDDIFISKLDSNGNFVWVKTIGGTGVDIAYALSLDNSSNIYITGRFQNTVDFDPGAGIHNLTSAGSYDGFILKFDSNGNFVWVHSMGGVNWDHTNYMTLDNLNNVYLTGIFGGEADIEFGPGINNITSSGGNDVFISKLDSNGNHLWTKAVGGTLSDSAQAIVSDSVGNIYIGGQFQDTVDFNPGAGTYNLISNGSNDAFILKLDSSGDFVWVKSMGGTGTEYQYSIAIDSLDNVYAFGNFQLTGDFDPGVDTYNLTSQGGSDLFISKLDSSGNFIWAKSIGGVDDEWAFSINIDNNDNIYSTGYFKSTVDFDPGTGTYNLISNGGNDAFILKLDSSSNFIWAKALGGTSNDFSRSLVADSSDNLYITIQFQNIVDVDPGFGISNLTSSGGAEVLILKLGDTSPTLTEVTPVPQVLVNQNTSSYTFSTDQAGTITYGGQCGSVTTTAVVGSNTINLNNLSAGTYNNCTIRVTDATSNISTPLTISPFDIVVHSGGGSSTPSTPTTPVTITPVITTPTTPIQTPEPVSTNPVNNNTNQNQTTLGNNKLCSAELILTQNLKTGARNNRYHFYTKGIVKEVKILQTHMNRLGFNSGKVDGILGPITDGAIKRMQAYLGTTQDGLVGPLTRDLINRSCD